ncbi:MAG: hypothetical protein IKR50_05780 [Prevotella sp.]|nr:hypothetical protein [Prevotella sp.]
MKTPALLPLLLASLAATAQTADPWLCSQNAAALTRFAGRNVATAELSMAKGKGGFTNYYDSPDALTVSATVSSVFRLNQKTVVFGAMGYDNFSGRDMAGSAFSPLTPHLSPLTSHPSPLTSHPDRHLPFDIVEDSLTNTGTKHLDVYRLSGGVGIDVCRGIALGARLDYTAANYAKYKDLRHQNKLMDLHLTAGAYVPLTLGSRTTVGLGANYVYHRTTESLLFKTYGKNEKVYKSLIDYANFTGPLEQFTTSGYTNSNREMPLVSDYNGAALQLSVARAIGSATLTFYNAATYTHRKGYYGRKSPFTITYTGHESDVWHYDARLELARPQSTLHFDLALHAENLVNNAANYRELQNESGASYYSYYTPNKAANKVWVDGSLTAGADFGQVADPTARQDAEETVRAWTLQLAYGWMHRRQTAYVYPFYRRQHLDNNAFSVSVGRRFAVRRGAKGLWAVTLDAVFGKGSGEPCEDLTFQTPSEKMEVPASMDHYLWQEYLWLTAAQYRLGGSVKYTFLFPTTQLRTYVKASFHHRKCNSAPAEWATGRDHSTATLAIGCHF